MYKRSPAEQTPNSGGLRTNNFVTLDNSRVTSPENQLNKVRSQIAVVNQGMGDGRMTMQEYIKVTGQGIRDHQKRLDINRVRTAH